QGQQQGVYFEGKCFCGIKTAFNSVLVMPLQAQDPDYPDSDTVSDFLNVLAFIKVCYFCLQYQLIRLNRSALLLDRFMSKRIESRTVNIFFQPL
ncbi:hypothetical protein KKF34_12155, partial [Myxococcota bacterium]|nr:hypothetical protein [Myxococcota bacterium]